MTRTLRTCVVVLAVFAVVAGSWAALVATSTPAHAKCGICPMYCLPVVCDNGRVYCNPCLAACAGAYHCVPVNSPLPL